MDYKRITQLVTGVSCPFFGIQWSPPQFDRDVAKETVIFLEDRRILYNPMHREDASDCIRSVELIRCHITTQRQVLNGSKELEKIYQSMQRACRRFMDYIGHPKYLTYDIPVQKSMLENELLKLREKIGMAIATIAISFGLDIPDELAETITFNNLENA